MCTFIIIFQYFVCLTLNITFIYIWKTKFTSKIKRSREKKKNYWNWNVFLLFQIQKIYSWDYHTNIIIFWRDCKCAWHKFASFFTLFGYCSKMFYQIMHNLNERKNSLWKRIMHDVYQMVPWHIFVGIVLWTEHYLNRNFKKIPLSFPNTKKLLIS